MGPGLRKSRSQNVLRAKHIRLVSLTEGVTRDWLDVADVVSEGRVESDGYFGSTSVLLVPARGESGERGVPDDIAPEMLLRLVECDPHIRTRVIRLARREATSRASCALGTMSVDLSFSHSSRGVAITVDVTASLATEDLAQNE
jgi:hypothetical protein